jgi:tRNA (guanine-N7-)-methyltransferase
MGKLGKLEKFKQVSEFSNCFEYDESLKGKWNSEVFKNDNPITLELACGKGEYSVGMGRMYPNRNFIGVDVKGNRIWKGARTALDEGLDNVAFLRTQISNITDYFAPGEVEEIWIIFPDPQPRKSKAKKRLTHAVFIERYLEFLKPGGMVRLKTDDGPLYNFTRETIDEEGFRLIQYSDDIYSWEDRPKELDIRTFYEDIWLEEGKKIKYVAFEPKVTERT